MLQPNRALARIALDLTMVDKDYGDMSRLMQYIAVGVCGYKRRETRQRSYLSVYSPVLTSFLVLSWHAVGRYLLRERFGHIIWHKLLALLVMTVSMTMSVAWVFRFTKHISCHAEG